MAEVLEMTDEHVLGGFLAEGPGRGGGYRAVVEGIEVTAGGQHIKPSARGRAGGAGGYAASVQSCQKRFNFARPTSAQGGTYDGVDLLDHGFYIFLVGIADAWAEFVVLDDGTRLPLGGHDQSLGTGFQSLHRIAIGAPR